MDHQALTVVKCPQCGKPVPWVKAQKYRPFCSLRCKTIDLGDWASGENAIPGEPMPAEIVERALDRSSE